MSRTKTERRPKIPQYLYKYQPFSVESIANLKNCQLWFSKPINFNDPFDCAIRPEADISDKEYELIFLSWQEKASDIEKRLFQRKYMENGRINQIFKDDVKKGISGAFEDYRRVLLSERGITCFSEKMDDVLMWSHYAQGHKGFCLEFDTSSPLFSKVFPVRYSKTIPVATPTSILLAKTNEEKLDVLDDPSNGWRQILATKAEIWAYEKEWRLLSREGNKLYNYGTDCLKRVYLGAAMSRSHKEIISMILQGSSTRLYELKREDNEFKLAQVEYTP